MKNGAILREVEATAELLDVANDFFFFLLPESTFS